MCSHMILWYKNKFDILSVLVEFERTFYTIVVDKSRI